MVELRDRRHFRFQFAKTCVEKKRRDRINKSLDELKELMAVTDEVRLPRN